MDATNCGLACGLVSQSYVTQGASALSARRKLIKALLSNRALPAEGWDEATIEMLLQDAALMDSNTFPGQVGLGEREGRVACPLVARRHGLLAHGIGRSGDITAEQPKAAGSSLLAKLCCALAADALKVAGLLEQGPAVVLPCATGMTLTLVLLAAASAPAPAAASVAAAAADGGGGGPGAAPSAAAAAAAAVGGVDGVAIEQDGAGPVGAAGAEAAPATPQDSTALQDQPQHHQQDQPQQQQQQQQGRRQYVVWSRIDQKTCLKSILAANLTPLVVPLLAHGDQVVTDVVGIQAAVEGVGPANVAAVVMTTSCFAPRAPDDVVAVAKLCAALGVTHVVNNAYGVQSAAIMKALTSACRRGRVDAIVQSTDKNFMVPVGGAVLSAPAGQGRGWLVSAVAQAYPGRAAMTPLLDLLTTLLYWGKAGWQDKLRQREELYVYLRDKLSDAAVSLGERLLVTPCNPISLAMTLDGLAAAAARANSSSSSSSQTGGQEAGSNSSKGEGRQGTGPASAPKAAVSFFGSMLWARNVSGTRVLSNGKTQVIGGISFQDYGCHTAGYPHPYMNAAAALGGSKQEVDVFVGRLVKAYRELQQKWAAAGSRAAGAGSKADAGSCAAGAAGAAGADSKADAGQ